jgi:hypothetical protein
VVVQLGGRKYAPLAFIGFRRDLATPSENPITYGKYGELPLGLAPSMSAAR